MEVFSNPVMLSPFLESFMLGRECVDEVHIAFITAGYTHVRIAVGHLD
jgi:hypothetical protein